MANPTIAFGIYKDGQLQGFRADSFGSILPWPKFYGYTPRQVEIVIRSTEHTALNAHSEKQHPMAAVFANINAEAAYELNPGLNAQHAKQKGLGNFEVRIIPFPQIEDHLDYRQLPSRELFESWVEAGLAEPLEVHAITPVEA